MTDLESKLKALVERAEEFGESAKVASLSDASLAMHMLAKCASDYRRAFRASELFRAIDHNRCRSMCTDDSPKDSLCRRCVANDASRAQASALLED